MDLTDDDLRALAKFLARRLTPTGAPPPPVTDLLEPVSPELTAGWFEALSAGRAAGRLEHVLRKAVAARPNDAALRETVEVVTGPAEPPADRRVTAVLALVAMLVLCLGLASLSTAGAVFAVQAALPDPVTVTVAVAPAPQRVHAVAQTEVARSVVVLIPPEPIPEVAPVLQPVESGTGEPEPEPMAEREPEVPAGASPCDEEGWFYVGHRRPKGKFVVPYPVNVRAQPPREQNGWRVDSPIRCYLRKGDVVTSDRPPVDGGRGQYWMHVSRAGVFRPARKGR